MDKIREFLKNKLNKEFVSAVLSNPKDKNGYAKIKVRSFFKGDVRLFQLEYFRNNQVFHENLEIQEACAALEEQMCNMRQMQFDTMGESYVLLVSKKGKVTIKGKKKEGTPEADGVQSHNRQKNYIIKEGMQVPFLKDLGVMTGEGKIVRAKYDKFRQINRFLEFIEDILPALDREREVTILDFGCGKSYLTFAMYYYLHEMKGYDTRIIGLDLKKEVIFRCKELGEKYGYDKLTFLEGDIADYTGVEKVDMVVTLHACDTATDYALSKAIEWGAKVILTVPCCQHELNTQIKNDELAPVLKYGLLKERMSALITDGLRAQYLEREGYDTQILEFIDMEHTPKNILIRGVKTGKKGENMEKISTCEKFLHVSPMIGKLLNDKGEFE